MTSPIKTLVLGAGLAVVTPMAVMAQETAPADAEEASSPPAYVLKPVVVSAERTGKTPEESLGPVSSRSGEDLDRWQPSTVEDLLHGIPGLTTSMSPGGGPGTKINIRGLEDFGRVNVMVDGTRQNFQRSGHTENTMVFVDPELIERVDVIRGPSAAIYGSGAIGGVVNFRTKDAADLVRPGKTRGATVTARAGTNADERLVSGIAYGLADWADIVASGSVRTRDDYEGGDGDMVDNTAWDQRSGLIKLTLTPKDGHLIRFSATRNESEYNAGTTDVDELKTTADIYKAEYRLTPPDMPAVDLTANLYYTTTEQTENRISGALLGRQTEVTVRTPGFDLFNTSRFALGGTEHALTYGVDGFRDDVDTSQAGGALPFTPGGKRRLAGAFVQDEVDLTDRLSLVAALRYDDYKLEGGSGIDNSDTELSPKLTAGYDVLSGVTVYGSWARAFRAPAITETLINGTHPPPAPFTFVPNPDLKPETAENWEVGVNASRDGLWKPNDRLTVKASVYRAEVEDYIEEYFNMAFFPWGAPNFPASTYGYRNVSEARLHGAELEVSYDVGFAYASLGATRARGKNETTGEKLASGLGDRATLTLGARERDLGLDGGWRLTARRGLDVAQIDDKTTADDDPASGYLLHGAYLNYTPRQFDNRLTLRLTAENIFDQAYRERLQAGSLQPGRTITLGGTIRF